MDDEERFELDEQVEAEELREYRRGLKMLERNPNKEIVEGCPWCSKRNYHFSSLEGWGCLACGYTPGADLRGGRYS